MIRQTNGEHTFQFLQDFLLSHEALEIGYMKILSFIEQFKREDK